MNYYIFICLFLNKKVVRNIDNININFTYMMEGMQNIRLFSRNMVRRSDKRYNMPAEHLELLSQLANNSEGLSPMTLSKLMGVNKTIISRILCDLDNKGYILKARDEKDRRSYCISITKLGLEHINSIYEYYLSPIYELNRLMGDEAFIKLMSYIEEANKKMSNDLEGVNK